MTSDVFNELLTWLYGTRTGGLTLVVLRISVILTVGWLAIRVVHRLIRGLRARLASRLHDSEAVKRAETLSRVFRYLVGIVIGVITIMLVLSELGVSLAPVLGAAGVVGIAVGFGAQSLVKDFFSGFFILLEDQIRTGDIVKIAGHAGSVEEVTLRYVRLRDYDGNVHFVPNGMIDSVINMTRGFSFAVMDVGVGYGEDVTNVIAVMRDVGESMQTDEKFGPRILEPLEIAGVDKWADSSVIVRCRFKVAPVEQWGVRREFLHRLKVAFDARGIEIPFPQLKLHRAARMSETA